MLPEGWRESTLGQIGTIKSGSTPERAKHDRYFIGGRWPWVKTMDLTNDLIELTDERITDDALNESSCRLFPVGTVLVAMYGGYKQIGRTGVLTTHSAVNQAISAIELDRRQADPMYVLHWLNGNVGLWRNYAASSRKDPNITRDDVCAFPIYLPSLDEQVKVARVLSTWNAALSATERLLTKSLEQKAALSQSLLAATSRSRLGLLPLARKPAAEIFSPVSVRANGHLPLLSVMQDVGVVPRDSLDRKVVMPDGSTESYKRVEPGNFVISLRSFEGGLEYSRHRGLVSPAYTVIEPRIPICDDFYRHYFKSSDFIGRLAVAVIGIRDGKQISYDDFAFLRLPAPSLREQQKIADALNAAEATCQVHQRQVERLRLEKRALMADLLTGRRRVRTDGHEVVQ